MYDMFEAMEQWGWVVWIGHHWILVAISVLHYFTVFWVVGSIALINLRILGLVGMRQTASQWQEQLSPWMWTAMVICLVSGYLEFAPGAGDFYLSNVFKFKIVANVVGVILAVVVHRGVPKWDRLPAMPASAKVLAATCILVWFGTILLGVEVANYGFF